MHAAKNQVTMMIMMMMMQMMMVMVMVIWGFCFGYSIAMAGFRPAQAWAIRAWRAPLQCEKPAREPTVPRCSIRWPGNDWKKRKTHFLHHQGFPCVFHHISTTHVACARGDSMSKPSTLKKTSIAPSVRGTKAVSIQDPSRKPIG